jgi:light-harvesting complex II chlorophyll a/b binding protein 5
MSDNALQEDSTATTSSSSSSSSTPVDNLGQVDALSQFGTRPWMSNYLMENLQQIPDEATCLQTLQQIRFSKAMPFMPRPYYLDGSMPGDYGFDPLGFVKSEEDLILFREAEIKHSRLAMLAAVGWPLSEFLNRKFASLVHLTPVVDVDGKAPNPVTDFDKVNANFWFVALLFGSFVEFYGTFRSFRKVPGYYPGNFGFDPLELYPKDEDEQKLMQLAEIKHGRTAMMAVLFYALEEIMTNHGVVPYL